MEKYNLLQVPSCVSSSQYIYIYINFSFSFFVFEVQQETNTTLKFDQIKSTKGQAVSKWHFIRLFEHWICPHFAIQNITWRFTLLFFNSLAQFCGCSGCYSTSQERSFPLRSHCQFWALCVCVCKSEILFDNLFLFPLTQEFSPPFLHSQLNNIKEGKALWWNKIMKSVTLNGRLWTFVSVSLK